MPAVGPMKAGNPIVNQAAVMSVGMMTVFDDRPAIMQRPSIDHTRHPYPRHSMIPVRGLIC